MRRPALDMINKVRVDALECLRGSMIIPFLVQVQILFITFPLATAKNLKSLQTCSSPSPLTFWKSLGERLTSKEENQVGDNHRKALWVKVDFYISHVFGWLSDNRKQRKQNRWYLSFNETNLEENSSPGGIIQVLNLKHGWINMTCTQWEKILKPGKKGRIVEGPRGGGFCVPWQTFIIKWLLIDPFIAY